MGQIKQDTELLGMIDEYRAFMSAEKRVDSPVRVCTPKKNHSSSLYTTKELYSETPFGNTTLNCEVRNGDNSDFSTQILSDKIKRRVVFRYDTGGGTHKNSVPFIPLAEQSITTPHFHKYDDNGYFLAYKTDILNDTKQSSHLFDIELGFPYFCQEIMIYANDKHDLPEIQVFREGYFSFKDDNKDPLEGINF